MIVTKLRRVANPHKAKRRSPAKRRTMSAKQIMHFGTTAQKAALKRKRNPTGKRKRNGPIMSAIRERVARAVAPRKRSTKRRAAKRNPVSLITLGFINPQKGRKGMAKRRSSTGTATRRRRSIGVAANSHKRRRNGTRIVVMGRRNGQRSAGARTRNPQLFGSTSTVQIAKMVAGGLVGVTAAKAIPGMLPGSLTGTPIMRSVSSLAVALGVGYAARKFMPDIADAVLFGGLMQAGSVALNSFLPSVGSTIGLQGMGGLGDIIGPACFNAPSNPLRGCAPGSLYTGNDPRIPGVPGAPANRVNVSGLNRSFGTAF